MGLTRIHEHEHATDAEMEGITGDFDEEAPPEAGYWNQYIVNDHVRIVVERMPESMFCTRSLIRSVLMFEAIEELKDTHFWLGRLYKKVGNELQPIAKNEVIGDTAFRQLYRDYGGTAKW